MDHPYRVIVTNGGSNYLMLSLVRVYGGDPPRVRHPMVERVISQARVTKPKGVPSGVCMPPEPKGMPSTVYERELQKLYRAYYALVNAPETVE